MPQKKESLGITFEHWWTPWAQWNCTKTQSYKQRSDRAQTFTSQKRAPTSYTLLIIPNNWRCSLHLPQYLYQWREYPSSYWASLSIVSFEFNFLDPRLEQRNYQSMSLCFRSVIVIILLSAWARSCQLVRFNTAHYESSVWWLLMCFFCSRKLVNGSCPVCCRPIYPDILLLHCSHGFARGCAAVQGALRGTLRGTSRTVKGSSERLLGMDQERLWSHAAEEPSKDWYSLYISCRFWCTFRRSPYISLSSKPRALHSDRFCRSSGQISPHCWR